jgi:hypothetical protein
MNVDTSEGQALVGFLATMSTEIRTPLHIGPVLRYAHAALARDFVEYMSSLAPTQSSRFHHVYEWGEIGVPSARLWRDVLKGHGAERMATFEWKASKKTVPVREDFAEKGVRQVHVFTWKAPVMEFDTNITITPKRGKWLAFFSGPTTPPEKYGMGVTNTSLTVENPGGAAVKGSFTREYVEWWGGSGAQASFNSYLNGILANDLDAQITENIGGLVTGVRSRNKSASITTISSASAAQAAGAAAARKFLAQRDIDYTKRADSLEAFIYRD